MTKHCLKKENFHKYICIDAIPSVYITNYIKNSLKVEKRKNYTGELRKKPQKQTTLVDEKRVLSLLKKKTFYNSWPDQKNLQEVSVSESTLQRNLHESSYSTFNTGCKPLVSFKKKNGKARVEFAKNILRSMKKGSFKAYHLIL